MWNLTLNPNVESLGEDFAQSRQKRALTVLFFFRFIVETFSSWGICAQTKIVNRTGSPLISTAMANVQLQFLC